MKLLIFSLDTASRQPSKDEYKTMQDHMETGSIVALNAKGVYKGREENSFICKVETELQEKMIMAIAHAYKQECVLAVDLPSRKGYLKYFDQTPPQYIGIWKEAGLDVKDDFTMDLSTMKIYKCYPETVDKAADAVVG